MKFKLKTVLAELRGALGMAKGSCHTEANTAPYPFKETEVDTRADLHAQMVQHLKDEYKGLVDVDSKDSEFDIEAAIYWFASDYHGGQWTDLYSVLSKSKYRPGSRMSTVADEGELVNDMYNSLVRKFGR